MYERAALCVSMAEMRAGSMIRGIAVLLFGLLALVATAEGYRKPTPAQAAKVSLGQQLTGADLERVKVGHQAGILKVVDRAGSPLFAKKHDGMVAIDGREWAPLTPASRDAILKALNVTDPEALASALMASYSRVSRAPALALLGALAYPGQTSPALSPSTRAKTLKFLRSRLQPGEDNVVRRQAVLALAIQPDTDAETVAAMLNFLRRDHNAWNTFGVVQFFEYQASSVRELPNYDSYVAQLGASGSPHGAQIARDLKAAEKAGGEQSSALPLIP